jgi:hypothetical protein
VGDARSLAEAMLDLITDDPLREAMGEAALRSSHRYDADPIADRYEALFTELRATRVRRTWTRGRARAMGWARRQTRRLRRTPNTRTPTINSTRPSGAVTPGAPRTSHPVRRAAHLGSQSPRTARLPHRPARLPGPMRRAARFRTAGGS